MGRTNALLHLPGAMAIIAPAPPGQVSSSSGCSREEASNLRASRSQGTMTEAMTGEGARPMAGGTAVEGGQTMRTPLCR